MRRSTLMPWLRLCRLPTVFTALADICIGFLLTHSTWEPGQEFACLLAASAGLYLSGMVFNDIFDVEQDRRERPQRPIPSGAVSLKGATIFGSILMLIGISSGLAAGLNSFFMALLTAIAILAYDRFLKRTPLGPVGMGFCRFLNILLGASSGAESFAGVWGLPQLWMALAMGIYVTGVTWFARTEAQASHRGRLIGALAVADLGLGLLLLWILQLPARVGIDLGPSGFEHSLPLLILWGAIVLTLNRRAAAAVANPIPSLVQPAIGSMLLSIISIDAMMIYFRLGPRGLVYCLCTLCLLAPAVYLRRWISMT